MPKLMNIQKPTNIEQNNIYLNTIIEYKKYIVGWGGEGGGRGM